ncbi:hypothetical protein JHW43_001404 [Diplocarpon mali]|nr:hypothetical protein JHW43_001404 [Diplocarpon mali]
MPFRAASRTSLASPREILVHGRAGSRVVGGPVQAPVSVGLGLRGGVPGQVRLTWPALERPEGFSGFPVKQGFTRRARGVGRSIGYEGALAIQRGPEVRKRDDPESAQKTLENIGHLRFYLSERMYALLAANFWPRHTDVIAVVVSCMDTADKVQESPEEAPEPAAERRGLCSANDHEMLCAFVLQRSERHPNVTGVNDGDARVVLQALEVGGVRDGRYSRGDQQLPRLNDVVGLPCGEPSASVGLLGAGDQRVEASAAEQVMALGTEVMVGVEAETDPELNLRNQARIQPAMQSLSTMDQKRRQT